MLNERAKQAQDYQARVRDEHKAQLLDQMQNDKRAKLEAGRMERQDDAQQAHRAGLFNSMFDQGRADLYKQQKSQYKSALDSQIQG